MPWFLGYRLLAFQPTPDPACIGELIFQVHNFVHPWKLPTHESRGH